MSEQANDPLNFMRNMWSNMGFSLPGMVAPTLDVDGLEKQIKDMRAVEGWLRMNLSMLQMTIQNLEMQRTTVSAVKTMSQFATNAMKPSEQESTESKMSDAVMFPWQMMQQLAGQMQQAGTEANPTNPVADKASATASKAKKPKTE